ncbi:MULTISPECIES: CBS domain-containing protein [unclassified Bacillus (in: firmicutes)]|uniref:CBS domain-containing protein n=1 Tax=unclassified Bacillus (in: firmicutes) TaxID=185979 RepID=UPI000BEF6672|nr:MULTISPECIES: CBS domain-containing protein [unclassified Bacillus (in: firmicutes)]PEJ49329.1 CBS domain-containing protein [Bacillus sp. AFS002410]PEL13409.1 CBS domain-containing protein [Bacillus sp. AFS017336]
MNIAFFFTPKNELVYMNINSTMRQALEKMEHHRYTAIPLVDDNGKYVGTLNEGDLLWKLKNTEGLSFTNTHEINLNELSLHNIYAPVSINAQIEDLFSRAINQNFIPVIDDNEVFIGMVKRREIIEYCTKKLISESQSI